MTGSNIPDGFKSAEDMTKQVFGIMDTNSDNQISLEEFLEGARKAQIIVDILQCDPDLWSKRRNSNTCYNKGYNFVIFDSRW